MESGAHVSRISPCDLIRCKGRETIELGGRVLVVSGTEIVVADAVTQVRVELVADTPVAPSDLVVVRGVVTGGALSKATLVERTTPHRTGLERGSEHERLSVRGVGKNLVARAEALRTIRRFFEDRWFLEVETPLVVPSPGLDLHLDAFAVPRAEGPGFSEGTGYLITSPEYQMKRLLAGGIPRCFQLARCFRRGEIGRRHNPEFTMLEWYRAFARVEDTMADTEALVRTVAKALGVGSSLNVLGFRVDLEAPFERLPVPEAFARYAGVDPEDAITMAESDAERFFRILVDAVEPALANSPRPVFLCDYPAPFASLARLKGEGCRLAERYELYVAGVELCNGFGELTDPVEQRARLVRDQAERHELGKDEYPIDERFLGALEQGMPPSSGNALGVDRLVAVCLGTDVIGEVQAFPVDWL